MTTKVDEALAAADLEAQLWPADMRGRVDEAAITLAAEVRRLRADGERLVMADGSPFFAWLESAPKADDIPTDEWTQGYEECRHRLAQILLPQLSAHKDQS